MKIMTRKEAISAGLRGYFTGVPCPHGHRVERRTCNGTCIECNRTTMRELMRTVPVEIKRRRQAEYYARKVERLKSSRRVNG